MNLDLEGSYVQEVSKQTEGRVPRNKRNLERSYTIQQVGQPASRRKNPDWSPRISKGGRLDSLGCLMMLLKPPQNEQSTVVVLVGSVTHACNPSYSGGRDQEDHSSKPGWQIVCETLSGKTHHRKTLVEWLKVQA
jgi:hypothetical protein